MEVEVVVDLVVVADTISSVSTRNGNIIIRESVVVAVSLSSSLCFSFFLSCTQSSNSTLISVALDSRFALL